MLGGLPRGHYGVVLADPPWPFKLRRPDDVRAASRGIVAPYSVMSIEDICALPVGGVAAKDCCLFLWISWPSMPEALRVIEAWGFTYKTCAFSWLKAHAGQMDMFRDDHDVQVGLGYWTRTNSEVCL